MEARVSLQVKQRDDGSFEVGEAVFQSKEAADMYLASRQGKTAPVDGIEKPNWSRFLSLLLAAPVAYYLVSCMAGGADHSDVAKQVHKELPAVSTQRALAACEAAYNMADGDIKQVPHTADRGTGGEYVFIWDSFPYGLLNASASYTVNKETMRVTSLMINGRSLR